MNRDVSQSVSAFRETREYPPWNTGVALRSRWPLGVELFFYNCILLMLFPLVIIWLISRLFLKGKSIGSWRHSLGLVPRLRSDRGPRIWVHAVSAGEMGAARPVLKMLRQCLPDASIALSSITSMGMSLALKSCPEANSKFYLPLDLPYSMLLALSRIRPALLIVLEKELWPNLLGWAQLTGARTLMINGRVSDRTMQRARRASFFIRWLYRLPDGFCVQSQQDADRLVKLGVNPTRIMIAGNTKVDTLASRNPRAESDLAAQIGANEADLWLVAGSTHPGEEEMILEAFRFIQGELPTVRLLLAPRHLERLPSVMAMLARRGITAARRTEQRVGASPSVVVLDTMGELPAAYGLGMVGFVGGTLAPIGGHNLLEPAAAGKPVLFGPHTESCADVAELVLDAGIGFRVSDSQELADKFIYFARNKELCDRISVSTAALIYNQQGAAKRCVEAAQWLLKERPA